jgi:hypothetical protein
MVSGVFLRNAILATGPLASTENSNFNNISPRYRETILNSPWGWIMQLSEIVELSTDKLEVLYDTVREALVERITQRNQELDALLAQLGPTKSPNANARRRRVARVVVVSRKIPAASSTQPDVVTAV